MVPTPHLGSGSTGTASSAPVDAAQSKGATAYAVGRGRRKGEGGRQTAAATEAKVAQEARDFVLNAPAPPKEPKFVPHAARSTTQLGSSAIALAPAPAGSE